MPKRRKIPDHIVWDENEGYNAKSKKYPTNLSSPKFDLPDVPTFRFHASKKMMDVFEQEKQEIIRKIEKLHDEYKTSIMVWESKISFEPIIGKSYFLYDFKGQITLSLISPEEWNREKSFIGEFILNSDNKWIKQERKQQ